MYNVSLNTLSFQIVIDFVCNYIITNYNSHHSDIATHTHIGLEHIIDRSILQINTCYNFIFYHNYMRTCVEHLHVHVFNSNTVPK